MSPESHAATATKAMLSRATGEATALWPGPCSFSGHRYTTAAADQHRRTRTGKETSKETRRDSARQEPVSTAWHGVASCSGAGGGEGRGSRDGAARKTLNAAAQSAGPLSKQHVPVSSHWLKLQRCSQPKASLSESEQAPPVFILSKPSE